MRAVIGGAYVAMVIAASAGAAQAQGYNWTGLYAGLSIGAARAAGDTRTHVPCRTNCWWFSEQDVDSINAQGGGTAHADAMSFGGHIGFNYQLGLLVVGLEGDLGQARLRTSRAFRHDYGFGGGFSGFDFTDEVATRYQASVRPRIGAAFGSVLVYATGGWAAADYKTMHAAREFGFGPPGTCGNGNYCNLSPGVSKWQYGWTAGGGIEWGVTRNWSVRGEYLYADYGKASIGSNLAYGIPLQTLEHSAVLSLHNARVGVSYRF